MRPTIFFLGIITGTAAFSQNPCNDLTFSFIKYSPFTDSVIVIELENNSSELFDYPGFVLIENGGDTLAKENVNLFGIGTESTHLLDVRAGIADPTELFNGVLELHTGFYDTLFCSWQLDQSLCADQPCDSVVIGLQNWGGALVLGDFEWTLWDSLGTTVIENGTFTMEAVEQYWQHSLCLPAGNYMYELQALGLPSGGGPVITISGGTSFGVPMLTEYFDWYTGAFLPFPFFVHCIDQNATAIGDQDRLKEPKIFIDGNIIRIETDEQVHATSFFNLHGQLLYRNEAGNKTVVLPNDMTDGIYLIQVETATGVFSEKLLYYSPK